MTAPDGRQRRELNARQQAVLDRLRRARNLGWSPETITEIAQALKLPPGQTLVAMKALERQGLAVVAGTALNGGRTWKSVPSLEGS